ncbi:MAG: Gfo/Idh/MocA family protein [Opitutales bacterium]
MTDRLKIGIIGAGVITRDMHLKTFRDHPDLFEVVAIADPDQEAAQARADEIDDKPRLYASHEDLIADDNVEVCLVAVPPYLAVPVAIDCLKGGLHVMSEKPMGNTGEDARRLYEQSLVSRGKLMIGENFFFIPAYVKLRQMARENDWPYGEPLMVHLHQFWKMTPKRIPQYYDSPWRHDKRLTWGYLIEGGCHTVNPIREAFGMPRGIQARMFQADPKLGQYDNLIANCRFDNGTVGQITMSYGMNTGPAPMLQIMATHGTIICQGGAIELLTENGSTEEKIEMPYQANSAYHAEWLHFHDVLVNGADLEFTAWQAYNDIVFCQDIIDAARIEPGPDGAVRN